MYTSLLNNCTSKLTLSFGPERKQHERNIKKKRKRGREDSGKQRGVHIATETRFVNGGYLQVVPETINKKFLRSVIGLSANFAHTRCPITIIGMKIGYRAGRGDLFRQPLQKTRTRTSDKFVILLVVLPTDPHAYTQIMLECSTHTHRHAFDISQQRLMPVLSRKKKKKKPFG